MTDAERIASALERIADQQAETLAELRRINATLLSTPTTMSKPTTYGSGLAVRTTDGLRELGNWEVVLPPHRQDCSCPKCKEAREEARAEERDTDERLERVKAWLDAHGVGAVDTTNRIDDSLAL